jgi:hypothetical protein
MIFASPLRRTWKHILATFAGGLVGTSPLIFANFYSYINRGYFISLQFQPVQSLRTFASFFDYIQKYLSMGAGNAAEGFILGLVLPGSSVVIETVLILLILVGIMILSPIRRSQSVFLRSAWIMLLGFIGIAVAFFYFPQNTGIYHWIVGTPFQYTCIGLFVADDAVKKEPAAWKKNLFKNLLLGLLVMFSVVRLGGLITLESAFLRGDSSAAWDISLTRIGEFAAQKQNKAIFIAGDWGVANQMICFVNGDPDVVFQVDPASGNVDEIIQVILHGKARDVYLIFPRLVYFTKPETRSLIAQRLSIGLSPGWEQQPSEEAIKGLKEIVVFKYKKIK